MSSYLLPIFAYVFGSIPFGLVIGKTWKAIDVRQYGSGNIGTSNVMRTVGRVPAAVVLVLDVLKGALPIWLGFYLGLAPHVVALTAFLAVCGHIFPWVLRFQGGKGIATAFGTAIAFDWRVAVTLAAIWVLVVVATRFISVGSIAASVAFPICVWIFDHPLVYVASALSIGFLAVFRHRSNISRLISGQEYRFGEQAATETGHR